MSSVKYTFQSFDVSVSVDVDFDFKFKQGKNEPAARCSLSSRFIFNCDCDSWQWGKIANEDWLRTAAATAAATAGVEFIEHEAISWGNFM